MPFNNRIIFPVDFSERARTLRPFVKSMAERLGARVTLLYAIQIPQNLYGLEQTLPMTLDFDAMVSDAKRELLKFYDESENDVNAVAEIGDPAAVIDDYARTYPPEVIMMPTHGYDKFRSLLLGSVVAKVLHDSPFPIWTAAHIEDPNLLTHTEIRSVVCALDLGPCSAVLLQRAVDFSARLRATLRLAHGVPDIAVDVDAGRGADYHLFLLDAAREQMAELQAQAGTDLETCIETLPPAQMVSHAAARYHADLVIAGRGHLQGSLGRLRTHAYSIIRAAPCPVVTF